MVLDIVTFTYGVCVCNIFFPKVVFANANEWSLILNLDFVTFKLIVASLCKFSIYQE